LFSHTEGGTKAEVFENRVLKKTFGHKRDEITRGWKILLNEELYDLCPSTTIIRVIKKSEIGWACDTYGGEERCIQGFGEEI
jgi:hypothetical protein